MISKKRDKRLIDRKSSSAAIRGGCGVKQNILRKIKDQHRKKLRLANKDIELEDEEGNK
jgi:hypothetical protein